MARVIITGASSGIGLAIAKKMHNDGNKVIDLSIGALPKEYQGLSGKYHGIQSLECDVSKYADVYSVAKGYTKTHGIDILINNAGNNYINWIEDTSDEAWDAIMNTNAKGIFNTTKVFMDSLMKSKGTILNIVSNASHMPMTNSIAYNASKGAAHIMTLQMSRELGPKGITVFGISPNRVAGTKMSEYIDSRVCELRGWTPEYAQEYQLSALPAGEETDADTLAEFIAFILSTKQRHKYMAGTVIPYGK